MIPPAVIRGSRLAYGSWKIICIRLRRRRNSAPLNSVTSWPSKKMRPPVGGLRRMIARPVVLLPQPDSPTSPSVSPRSISNVTPSTAWTSPTWRCRMIPSRIGNQTFRPSSRRSGTLPAAAVAPVEVTRPTSVVMEDPAFAVVLGLGWDRQPAGRRPERERPLLGLDVGDHAFQVGGRADPSAPTSSIMPAGGGADTKPGLSGLPAAASSWVGGLKQAIWWVASVPVMTTRVPSTVGRSGGFSCQQMSSRQRQRAANGQTTGRGACPAAVPRSG